MKNMRWKNMWEEEFGNRSAKIEQEKNYLSCRTELLVTFISRKYFKEKGFIWRDVWEDGSLQLLFTAFHY